MPSKGRFISVYTTDDSRARAPWAFSPLNNWGDAQLLPVGGDPNPAPVGSPPCPLDPNRVARWWEPAFRARGCRPVADIIRIGISTGIRGVRPAVNHLEKRVSDRVRRTPAPLRILTPHQESRDSTKNGNKFPHDQKSAIRVAAPCIKTGTSANDPAVQN